MGSTAICQWHCERYLVHCQWKLLKGKSAAQSKSTHSWKPELSTTEHDHQTDEWPLGFAPTLRFLWNQILCRFYKSFGQDYNRQFPEITWEIIWKSEAPAIGCHFRHGLLAYIYIGPWFQNGGGSQKVLVCDSIRPSGMDLYYTVLPDVHYALETLLFPFLYAGTPVFLARPHVVCPFGMADWLNRLRAFIIYTVFLIKKKKCFVSFLIKKSSVPTPTSSLAFHGLPKADAGRGSNTERGIAKPVAPFHHYDDCSDGQVSRLRTIHVLNKQLPVASGKLFIPDI